jgi:p21-activated kinase 1
MPDGLEVTRSKEYGLQVNIWSLGIIATEMMDGQPPYWGETPIKVLDLIATNSTPQIANPEVLSLTFRDCLSR